MPTPASSATVSSGVDLLLSGGQVIDGTGAPARQADIAVRDGRVVAVGASLHMEAARHIDATGLTVTPGFIDPHSHSDWSVLGNRDAQSTVRQGVTTEIVGNCGVTYAPLAEAGANEARRALRAYGYEGPVSWRTFPELLDVVHRQDRARRRTSPGSSATQPCATPPRYGASPSAPTDSHGWPSCSKKPWKPELWGCPAASSTAPGGTQPPVNSPM